MSLLPRVAVIVLVASLVAFAGCSGGTQSGEGGATPTPTPTPTPSPEAEFEIVEIVVPEEVEAGEPWSPSLTVRNVGDVAGTYETAVYAGEAGEELEHTTDIALEVEAGETATYNPEPAAIPYVTRIEYYLEEPDVTKEVSILTASLSFGETFRDPNEIEMTVHDVELRDYYTYKDWEGVVATEEASDGYQWAFVEFEATNEAGLSEWLPSDTDVNILWGNSQYGEEYIQKEEGAYEGGEVADGIIRKGWIAYEVPDDLSVEDLEIHHSGSDSTGEWEVIWRK